MADQLTRREIQCVRLAGEALSNKEIATRLNVSPSTVNNHLSSAYAKLATSNRQAAATLVARDYPDYSRLTPIPIGTTVFPVQPGARPGDEPAPSAVSTLETWFLPPPPKGRLARLIIMLGMSVVAAVITIGLVAIVGASLSSFSEHAPSNAVQAPQSNEEG